MYHSLLYDIRMVNHNAHEFTYISSLHDSAKYFKKYFSNDASIIFDIGSRDGDDAVMLSELIGGIPICIEADPKSSKRILDKHKNVIVLNTAILDYDGTTEFTRLISDFDDVRGASSVGNAKIDPESDYFEAEIYGSTLRETISIPCSRMDSVLKDLRLQNSIIDFVKIDTEGYSWQVIESFGECLSNIRMLHVETEINAMHDRHVNNLNILERMENLGFTLINFYTEWGDDMQDHLYVNKKFIVDHKELESIADIIRKDPLATNRSFRSET